MQLHDLLMSMHAKKQHQTLVSSKFMIITYNRGETDRRIRLLILSIQYTSIMVNRTAQASNTALQVTVVGNLGLWNKQQSGAPQNKRR